MFHETSRFLNVATTKNTNPRFKKYLLTVHCAIKKKVGGKLANNTLHPPLDMKRHELAENSKTSGFASRPSFQRLYTLNCC
jgi:hypothetical protein